ncbi:hypothetical protein [Bradyrhizobium sp. CCGUVB23]|nr:hypothetical protein [Bradyrhizobium sp. CCGUVB23]
MIVYLDALEFVAAQMRSTSILQDERVSWTEQTARSRVFIAAAG